MTDIFEVQWILIRTPNQEFSQDQTTPPVEPFETGFMSASIESIGQHLLIRLDEAEKSGEPTNQFVKQFFGVLDERSIRDRTLLLAQKDFFSPEPERQGTWHTMRVTFEQVVLACAQVPERPWCFFDAEIARNDWKILDEVWEMPTF